MSRGASLLAGVVFIAILGVVGLTIQSTLPASTPSAQTALVGPTMTAQDLNISSSQQPTVIEDILKSGEVSCRVGPTQYKPVPVYFACDQETTDNVSNLKQTCSPGFDYYVIVSGSKVTVQAVSKQKSPPYGSCTLPTIPQCTANNTPALVSYSTAACVVTYCEVVGGKTTCSKPVAPGGKSFAQVAADPITKQGLLENFLSQNPTSEEVNKAISQLVLNQGQIDAAYTAAQTSVQQQIDTNQAAIDQIKSTINTCNDPSCAGAAQQLDQQQQQLTVQNAALQRQLSNLKQQASTLAPTPQSTCEATKSCNSPQPPQTPSNPSVNPNPCTVVSTQPLIVRGNCNLINGNNTFAQQPQQQPPSNSQGSLGSGLMQALQGLLQGLGAGGAGGPSQTCSTDSAIYQQQQQQYQQQLQQYQIALQQYNYQLQLNALYGNNNQPPIPPVAPRPCMPGGDETKPPTPPRYPPTAQISCQPQVADPGMTIAISYSCSSGRATGTGFTAKRQPSGSATATVAVPPAGINVATYGLTCSGEQDRGAASAHAQCAIQISRPSIVLVANPKTVQSGETSLLGWITSGMQSCVISSPQQDDFTARNASNTSPNGTAETSPVTTLSTFILHCETLGGSTKEASTTIAAFSP